MADKPSPKIAAHQARVSAQGSPRPIVQVSFQSEPLVLPANESLDVQGYGVVHVYNESGGAAVANAHATKGGTPIPLVTAEGTAISVGDDVAQPVAVVGVGYLSFSAEVTVICAG